MVTLEQLACLHRYWITADRMKIHFQRHIGKEGALERMQDPATHYAEFTEARIYMDLWYGLLYVVIDGWGELKLSDPHVDECLMEAEYVKLARRYRNAAFHYQHAYYHEKFSAVWEDRSGFVVWALTTHEVLGEVILRMSKHLREGSEGQ